jgi:hypothetical protein
MTERQLQYRTGSLLVSSHLLVITAVIGFRFANGFSTDEFTTLLALVTPVFSGYTASFVAFVVAHRHATVDASKPVTTTFVVLTWLLPVVLSLLILAAIALKAFNRVFTDFEDFKRFLILLESVLSGYIGTLIYTLFPHRTVPASANARR